MRPPWMPERHQTSGPLAHPLAPPPGPSPRPLRRPDVLDPALLRPGRLDRKIEIPLPNETARMEILKIHAIKLSKHGDIDYEAVVKLAEGFNGGLGGGGMGRGGRRAGAAGWRGLPGGWTARAARVEKGAARACMRRLLVLGSKHREATGAWRAPCDGAGCGAAPQAPTCATSSRRRACSPSGTSGTTACTRTS
jgi:hypothetical protein